MTVKRRHVQHPPTVERVSLSFPPNFRWRRNPGDMAIRGFESRVASRNANHAGSPRSSYVKVTRYASLDISLRREPPFVKKNRAAACAARHTPARCQAT